MPQANAHAVVTMRRELLALAAFSVVVLLCGCTEKRIENEDDDSVHDIDNGVLSCTNYELGLSFNGSGSYVAYVPVALTGEGALHGLMANMTFRDGKDLETAKEIAPPDNEIVDTTHGKMLKIHGNGSFWCFSSVSYRDYDARLSSSTIMNNGTAEKAWACCNVTGPGTMSIDLVLWSGLRVQGSWSSRDHILRAPLKDGWAEYDVSYTVGGWGEDD